MPFEIRRSSKYGRDFRGYLLKDDAVLARIAEKDGKLVIHYPKSKMVRRLSACGSEIVNGKVKKHYAYLFTNQDVVYQEIKDKRVSVKQKDGSCKEYVLDELTFVKNLVKSRLLGDSVRETCKRQTMLVNKDGSVKTVNIRFSQAFKASLMETPGWATVSYIVNENMNKYIDELVKKG